MEKKASSSLSKKKTTPTSTQKQDNLLITKSSGDDDINSEFEDVLEVNKNNEDYFEIPSYRRKKNRTNVPPPSTKDLVYIPKEKLMPFKDLYEKQPQKIKEMLRITFCDGKPITKPPPLGLFVNRVRKLQDKKKSRKQISNKWLRDKLLKDNNKIVGGGGDEGKFLRKGKKVSKINVVDTVENDVQLVHVEYPGRIVHIDKAIETMGGIGEISKVFNNVNKKLSVRFRPDDPCCNAVRGETSPTVGLLLKVRYRKPTQKQQPLHAQTTSCKKKNNKNNDTNSSTTKVEQVDEDSIIINGVRITKSQVLYEDNQFSKQATTKNNQIMHQYHPSQNPGDSYLRIPKNYRTVVDQKIRIETLGLVNRSYKFDGICDFQYLPSKPSKTGLHHVSTRDKLFPVIGKGSDNNDSLFVCEKLFQGEDRDEYEDLLPPMMSRIDRPVDSIIDHLMDSDNVKLTAELKEKSGVISTTRARRNVYTIFYNFQTERHKVPSEPLKGATEDVKKRPKYETYIEQARNYFQEKPIWNKVALEYEAKQSSLTLKYILPCIAYFATSGPWRALWIRFGYDPREQQTSFLYQTVDFRVPGIYKCFMIELDKVDETFFSFRPNLIPPRGQMFYQLCHLKCEEIDRLIEIASKKASNNELPYDVRFGWFKEGTFEYIRHVIVRYIEAYLEELGKISEHPMPRVFLPDDELEPTEKLLPRPRTVKRLRKVKSYKPKKPSAKLTTKVPKSIKKKPTSSSKQKSKVKGKESSRWKFQGILEDLSIKEINKYGSRKDDEKDEILDDTSLLSDDFDDDSTTEESEVDIK